MNHFYVQLIITKQYMWLGYPQTPPSYPSNIQIRSAYLPDHNHIEYVQVFLLYISFCKITRVKVTGVKPTQVSSATHQW